MILLNFLIMSCVNWALISQKNSGAEKKKKKIRLRRFTAKNYRRLREKDRLAKEEAKRKKLEKARKKKASSALKKHEQGKKLPPEEKTDEPSVISLILPLVGSVLTTVFIGGLEKPLALPSPLIESKLLSALVGAAIIAVASGIMFYVDSSSGGTDIIALIVKKYSRIKIGKALLVTDILIVLGGGLLSGFHTLVIFTAGFLVKVLGIDLVILIIEKFLKKKEKTE